MTTSAQFVSPSARPVSRVLSAGAARAVNRRSGERGAALLAAMCFTLVLALALASYLSLCYRSLQMSTRNLNGGHSVELAETGMEEALWALHSNTDWGNWTPNGKTMTKTLTGFTYDGGATGSVTMTITNYDGTTGTRALTVTGVTQLSDGTSISRTLSSTSSPAPVFVNALAAITGNVTFSSGGSVDSYDSSTDPNAATLGYSAIVASESTATAAATVQLVNAQVKGYVATLSTGPSNSSSGKLLGPSTPVGTNIDVTRESLSPYQPIVDIKTISGSGTTLFNPATNSTTTIGVSTDTSPRIYYCSGLDLTGTTKIIVDGPVQLVMTSGGAFYIGLHGGTPSIQVNATGSLEVFTTGDIAIYGGGISNASKNPRNVAVYGTNSLTVPDMNTTTPYYGVIYTPNGSFSVAGSTTTIFGAVVAAKVNLTASAPVIHYDMNLRQAAFAGLDTTFAVANVIEPSP